MADQTDADDILSDPPDRDASGSGPAEGSSEMMNGDPSASGPASVRRQAAGERYDAAIVGASLAGCSAAMLLARSGARVALVEKSPDVQAFKRICTHYIQSSAMPTLERLGLLEPMMEAGALRSRARLWTRWGWIESPADSTVASGVNLRREQLDPLVRRMAAETPGVELILGHTVQELVRDGGTISGVRARDAHNQTLTLRAQLVIGADGRDSRVAKLAGVRAKTVPHGRFAYGAYFEGPPIAGAPDAALWLLDPDMVAAFPTDGGLTFYVCMPTMEHLPKFRDDPTKALVEFVAGVPEAPPIEASRMVGQIQGKLDMTNVSHTPTAPGFALIGDAALAIDPLWGVGCGWALQSSEWLADSVVPALSGSEPLEKGLKRYSRRYARKLRGHAALIHDYSGGKRFNPGEKGLFFSATRDAHIAGVMEAYATRNIGPARMFALAFPRTTMITARHWISSRRNSDSASPGAQAQRV